MANSFFRLAKQWRGQAKGLPALPVGGGRLLSQRAEELEVADAEDGGAVGVELEGAVGEEGQQEVGIARGGALEAGGGEQPGRACGSRSRRCCAGPAAVPSPGRAS